MGLGIVFAHQNYPAQFGGFAAWLARTGWEVTFITAAEVAKPPPGCRIVRMTPHREPAKGVHRFALGLEKAMINGQAFANAAIGARDAGVRADVVVAHSGWGSGTFARAVWPGCRYVPYVEWYYRHPPLDRVLSEAKRTDEDGRAYALARNAPTLLDLAEADLVFCPTRFQAAQFPAHLRRGMRVMHDGVDTRMHAPDPAATPPAAAGALPQGAEIVSYATRGMEPHRGFPEFMRALERLQRRRPRLHAVIGGENRVSYGPKPAGGRGWKEIMLEELDLDERRISWTGLLPRGDYVRLLQSTHVHVYLTVPFVLSWSLIEAMSVGAPLVLSDTEPVREAATHEVEAELVDHRDPEALADAIERMLDDRDRAGRMGRAARARVLRDYDAAWIWPWRRRVLEDLVRYGPPG